MLGLSHRRRRAQHGVTLVELMVVVAVIALLALAMIAQFRGARANAVDGRSADYIDQIRRILGLYTASNAVYPSDAATLVQGADNSGGAVYTALAAALASIEPLPTTLAASPLGGSAAFHYTPNVGATNFTLWATPTNGTGKVICADAVRAVVLDNSSGITNGSSCQ